MKHLIIILISLMSVTTFAQNYHYALDDEPTAADTENPTAPMDLVVSNIKQTTANLSWTAATDNIGVVNYIIYNNGIVMVQSTGNVTSYNLVGLTENTDYILTVRAIDAANNESADSNFQTFTTEAYIGTKNQPEEIEYFDAYLLTPDRKCELQTALDTYGSVRLEKGDYNGCGNITMKSNQKLYGSIGISSVDAINIEAGSTNVIIEQLELSNDDLTLLPGAPITNCRISSVYGGSGGRVVAIGAQLEDNEFFDIRCRIFFDMSASGYIRNNTIHRQVVQGYSPQTVMYGNPETPSFGNVEIGINHLTSDQVSTDYVNLESVTILGLDAEGWNQKSSSTSDNKAMLYMREIGEAKVTDIQGGNGYAISGAVMTPSFDVEANNLIFFGKAIGVASTTSYNSKFIGSGNYFGVNATEQYDAIDFLNTGYTFRSNYDPLEANGADSNDILLNNKVVTGPITGEDATTIKSTLLGTQHTPFARPTWNTLPNPLGSNWREDRIGQTDSHDYIQNLINNNGIAELPEGIFYIGSSLVINNEQGISGSGTGKTVIVGLADDFPLVIATDDEDTTPSQKYRLGYLTLQGGSTGLEFDTYAFQVTSCTFKYLIFRDQTQGLHMNRCYALDNMFFDNISFVNCGIGFFQDPELPRPTAIPSDSKNNRAGVYNNTAYLDKCYFYKNQVINCDIGFSLIGDRANNMETWADCLFDGNGRAMQGGGRSFLFANSDFKNHTGDAIIWTRGGGESYYNCNFYNNSVSSIFDGSGTKAEGCNFNDNVPLLYDVFGYDKACKLSIMNSTVKGDVGDLGRGLLVNTSFLANPELNHLLIQVQEPSSTKRILLNETPTPYPQFLVKY